MRPIGKLVPVSVVLMALLGQLVLAPPAEAQRAALLRQATADFLGGAVDSLAGPFALEDAGLGDALLEPIGGGADDLQQSLGAAVFAVPVAGNIGYVLRAQVFHDLPIVFPVDWGIVQVFVGDPSRWRVVQNGSLVVVQPGEPGARTNLNIMFTSGELVQIDLEEHTGAYGLFRTGRAYVGPEPWLLDRIFALMPLSVRDRVIDLLVSDQLGVGALLADPVEAIRPFDVFSALPPPAEARRLPRFLRQALDSEAQPPDSLPLEMPAPAAEPSSGDDPAAPDQPVDAAEAAVPDADVAPVGEPGGDMMGPPLLPLEPLDDPAAAPPPADPLPADPPGAEPDPDAPDSPPAPELDLLRPFGGIELQPQGASSPTLLPGGAFVMPARAQASVGASVQAAPPPSGPGDPPEAPAAAAPEAVVAPLIDRFVSGRQVAELERRLAEARAARDDARRRAGDRIADATLGIDGRLSSLRADYPGRVQFSILIDPEIPPFTPPFWHLGVWHDGDYTYWRILADNPRFHDQLAGVRLDPVRLDDHVYRLDRVVDRGMLVVDGPDFEPRRLYWRRREELEGP